MIRISPRQLTTIIVLGAITLLAAILGHFNIVTANGGALMVFLAAALAVLSASGDGASPELFDGVRAGVRRVLEGKKPDAPIGSPLAVIQVYQELQEAHQKFEELSARSNRNETELQEAAASLSSAVRTLTEGVAAQLNASDESARYVKEVTNALREIAQHVEVLAASAEESSSSVLQMTATNEQVGGNILELAASVRETVASIEEMAYSIKEVAKNVDALSLTAEETSSSMNEMDVSIDQVQSNANETARLSEEVAQDAERGAEAILKTIGEIYRIKESSQEAVAVISNLGSRIDAIGQILNVIDDVAEQTNLLALNAAIIAAQAGEHGKGFAVVADEIKDLAERAGASTNMVRAIALATVEQAKGSKQVTDAIGRIAETVQQIAAATAEQARGSELIMKSAEKMRTITQHVERSSQEQARGGRQITTAIEQISNMVNNLNSSQRTQMRGGEQLLDASRRIEESARTQDQAVRQLNNVTERLRRALT